MTEAQGILRHYADKMFHPHPLSELRKLREAGKAVPIVGFNFAYDEVEPKAAAQAPEDLDSEPDEETEKPQTYTTRDMTAAPKVSTTRRRPRARANTST